MPQSELEFDDQSDGDGLVSLREVAARCGVSLSTLKRRLADGRIPEARLSTPSGGRRQWGIPVAEVGVVARREGWSMDRNRDEIDGLTLPEAHDALRSVRKALVRSEDRVAEGQQRVGRLVRVVERERALLAKAQTNRARVEHQVDALVRQARYAEGITEALRVRLAELGDTTTYEQLTRPVRDVPKRRRPQPGELHRPEY